MRTMVSSNEVNKKPVTALPCSDEVFLLIRWWTQRRTVGSMAGCVPDAVNLASTDFGDRFVKQ